MPILQQFSASRILMYAGNHLPPHIHVKLRDGREYIVDIESNRALLHGEWRRYNP
jgi:hypothetical protein